MKKPIFRAFCAASTIPVLMLACGSTEGEPPQGPSLTAKGAALLRVDGCGDLLAQIQADAISKLDAQTKRYQERLERIDELDDIEDGSEGQPVSPGRDFDENTSDPGPAGDGGDGDGDSAVPPTVGGDNAGGESEEPSDPKSHSETNTQVANVDEADIVKVSEDGKRLFLVHGSEFKIVQSWPPSEMEQSGAAAVAGSPHELFVRGDRAVVFSLVRPEGIGSRGQQPKCGDCCSSDGFVQVSTYDVSGASPKLVREVVFEGDYVSSRRYDDTVRLIVRGGFEANDLYYPDIDYYDTFDRPKSQERLAEDLRAWRRGVESDIRSTTLSDWVPRSYEKKGGSWVEMSADCDGYFVPEPGLVQGGVTRVVTFDMTRDELPQATSVLGGSDTVYSSRSQLVVTQHNWMWDEFGLGEGPQTSVHSFTLEGETTNYEASGFAPGYLIDQFAIHEDSGVIFVTTTEEVHEPEWDTKNTIISLKEEADSGVLEVLDRSEPMGEPLETVFATRFLGDRAYVVTFRQTDPLYAVDISDPSDIQILGELHIPGFSDYIHPLGEHHLLTIGMETGGAVFEGDVVVDIGDAPAETEEGVALQIFDVGDPSAPRLVHKELFGGFSHSEANGNHKAFTFVSDHFGDDRNLLAFPLVSYEPDYRAGLEVLQVSVEDGFSRLGTIDHSELLRGPCDEGETCSYRYYYGQEMRRGIQIDDYIYAVGQGGITVHDLAQMDEDAVATVVFDAPRFQEDFCGDYDGRGDVDWDGDEDVDWEDEPAVDVPTPDRPPEGAGGASGAERGDSSEEGGDGDLEVDSGAF